MFEIIKTEKKYADGTDTIEAEHDHYALELGLKYFPEERDELMRKIAVRRDQMYVWRFLIEHMTGELVYEI